MTCIAAIKDNGTIYMGADSALSGNFQGTWSQPKIFRKGEMLIGVSGYPRMTQIMQYQLQIPIHRENEQSVIEYMTTSFVDALRTALKDAGFAEVKNNQECACSYALIAYKSKIFELDDNYQVLEYTDDFMAIGSGSQLALGAMFATEQSSPEIRLETALRAAANFNAYCAGPFNYLTLESVK